MPSSINLANAFRKGRIVKVDLNSGEKYKPPASKAWWVLYGYINHTTGNITYLRIMDADQETTYRWLTMVPAATGSGQYPLFNMATEVTNSQGVPFLFLDDNGDFLYLYNVGGATARLVVLEWEK